MVAIITTSRSHSLTVSELRGSFGKFDLTISALNLKEASCLANTLFYFIFLLVRQTNTIFQCKVRQTIVSIILYYQMLFIDTLVFERMLTKVLTKVRNELK